jgi:glycerol-3-phosphate dehydrogenase (NAD(P)+)
MKKAEFLSGDAVVVVGDGGWGTTLAMLLHEKGMDVTLWGAFPEYVKIVQECRENVKFLPGVQIPKSLRITADLGEALRSSRFIITAVPSHYMRSVCMKIRDLLPPPAMSESRLIINGAKGLEMETLMRMSEVIHGALPGIPAVVLSGPSHAEEVARGNPATVVVASDVEEHAILAQNLLMAERFRVYTNTDVLGVEIAGALKNVIAIAAGASDGLGFGDNAKAALITRGIVEITRLGVKLGAQPSTFSGLAGIGDLIATCVSNYGRNRRVGELIAQGKRLEDVLAGTEMVAEGVRTAKAAYELAKRHNVEMPLTEQVYLILYRGKEPEKAVRDLMLRSAKPEIEQFEPRDECGGNT